MAEKTIFERIIDNEIPHHLVYSDDIAVAFLDAFPNHLGHTLVVTKNPYPDVYEIPDSVASHLFPLIRDVAKAVKEACEAEGINIVMNNGESAGQIVFHSHIHIIPRFKNDGGYVGHHVKYKDNEEAVSYATKIRLALEKIRTK